MNKKSIIDNYIPNPNMVSLRTIMINDEMNF